MNLGALGVGLHLNARLSVAPRPRFNSPIISTVQFSLPSRVPNWRCIYTTALLWSSLLLAPPTGEVGLDEPSAEWSRGHSMPLSESLMCGVLVRLGHRFRRMGLVIFWLHDCPDITSALMKGAVQLGNPILIVPVVPLLLGTWG